ncbi:MAG: hypothetical protein MI919_29630 [Holophagales bacterium]|nr:hypothetical protein [Holophagales bacterium]
MAEKRNAASGEAERPHLALVKNEESALQASGHAFERVAQELLDEDPHALRKAGLSFVPSLLVQCTMPHREPAENEFVRDNGRLVLTMSNDSSVGLPSGRYPRLLMAWTATEVLRTQSPELHLGNSFSDFISQLGLPRTGGKRGTFQRLKSQMEKFYSARITVRIHHEEPRLAGSGYRNFQLADEYDFWWDPAKPEQISVFDSRVLLTDRFFESIRQSPVPVELRALRALRSPLALDLYVWLGYRMFLLNRSGRKKAVIPWAFLRRQFGAEYKHARDFRRFARQALQKALVFYPDARVDQSRDGKSLVLEPSPLPIEPRASQR